MDYQRVQNLRKIAAEQIEHAQKFCELRERAGIAKTKLELLLTAQIPAISGEKKNVGVEMAYLMLMEIEPAAKEFYQEWQDSEAKYRGLEKLLDAYATRISLEQSIFRYVREGEKWTE